MKALNDGEDGPMAPIKKKLDPKKKAKMLAAKSGVASKLKAMLMERSK